MLYTKYYILCKRLEHPWIWVSVETTPVDSEGQLDAVALNAGPIRTHVSTLHPVLPNPRLVP